MNIEEIKTFLINFDKNEKVDSLLQYIQEYIEINIEGDSRLKYDCLDKILKVLKTLNSRAYLNVLIAGKEEVGKDIQVYMVVNSDKLMIRKDIFGELINASNKKTNSKSKEENENRNQHIVSRIKDFLVKDTDDFIIKMEKTNDFSMNFNSIMEAVKNEQLDFIKIMDEVGKVLKDGYEMQELEDLITETYLYQQYIRELKEDNRKAEEESKLIKASLTEDRIARIKEYMPADTDTEVQQQMKIDSFLNHILRELSLIGMHSLDFLEIMKVIGEIPDSIKEKEGIEISIEVFEKFHSIFDLTIKLEEQTTLFAIVLDNYLSSKTFNYEDLVELLEKEMLKQGLSFRKK